MPPLLNQQLLEAARKGDTHSVAQCLHDGADVNAVDSEENTPLMLAVFGGYIDAARELLKHPQMNVSAQDDQGRTALMIAVYYCRPEFIEPLKSTINEPHDNGETPLIIAARLADQPRYEAFALQLLKHGADAGTKDNLDKTALWYALHYGCKALIMPLLEAGATPNATSKWNGELLLAPGTDPEVGSNWSGTPLIPIIMAIQRGWADVVEALLDRGADANITDHKGRTPLMWAAKSKRRDICKILLSHGATMDPRGKVGSKAFTQLVDIFRPKVKAETTHSPPIAVSSRRRSR